MACSSFQICFRYVLKRSYGPFSKGWGTSGSTFGTQVRRPSHHWSIHSISDCWLRHTVMPMKKPFLAQSTSELSVRNNKTSHLIHLTESVNRGRRHSLWTSTLSDPSWRPKWPSTSTLNVPRVIQSWAFLQWSDFKKTMILIIVSLYSFLGNSALLGPSVYIGIYSEEFKITPATASGLISYPNLAFGFGQFHQTSRLLQLTHTGSLLLVPLYLKIGRRPVMLLSLICVGLAMELYGRYWHGIVSCGADRFFTSKLLYWTDDRSCLPCFWLRSMWSLACTTCQRRLLFAWTWQENWVLYW